MPHVTGPFQRLLIANRGEIACRIIRSARGLGLSTVATYSDADAASPHVRLADQAVRIGEGPPAQSYLRIEAIIAAARASGAQAIHPGYGFLSENADFAQACADAGLIFVGPSPQAIAAMGDKGAAKQAMIAAGVPCIPGYEGEDQGEEALLKAAKTIGFPLMVKAAAGGGGRGIRLVSNPKDLAAALTLARSEAENAFGSGRLILERALLNARHVEIQVFADAHGAVIHLGERDCSAQRRRQKVIEEAPSPAVDPELRAAMGADAVAAARAVGYLGAGTVEFLLDERGKYYFLEMNTRLQVEHPVTEMITGMDLVAMQLRVAQGLPLGLSQDGVRFNGHAIEARLYAEDPAQDFLPATGTVVAWAPPLGQGVRVDAGVESGAAISPFYDPMIAKVIAYGQTREEARLNLRAALKDAGVVGLKTNQRFLIDLLDHGEFIAGTVTTTTIERAFTPDRLADPPLDESTAILAAVIQTARARERALSESLGVNAELLGWSSADALATPVRYALGERELELRVAARGSSAFVVNGEAIRLESLTEREALLIRNGARIRARFAEASPGGLLLQIDGASWFVQDRNALPPTRGAGGGEGLITAPMHGVVVRVVVEVGAAVRAGDTLLVLEAMKMQHEILADIDASVESLHCKAGEQVVAGAVLVELKKPQ